MMISSAIYWWRWRSDDEWWPWCLWWPCWPWLWWSWWPLWSWWPWISWWQMIMYTMMTMILQDWLNANFKKTERRELVIIKSENVLTPTSLQKVSCFQNAQIKAKYAFEESSHDEGVVSSKIFEPIKLSDDGATQCLVRHRGWRKEVKVKQPKIQLLKSGSETDVLVFDVLLSACENQVCGHMHKSSCIRPFLEEKKTRCWGETFLSLLLWNQLVWSIYKNVFGVKIKVMKISWLNTYICIHCLEEVV